MLNDQITAGVTDQVRGAFNPRFRKVRTVWRLLFVPSAVKHSDGRMWRRLLRRWYHYIMLHAMWYQIKGLAALRTLTALNLTVRALTVLVLTVLTQKMVTLTVLTLTVVTLLALTPIIITLTVLALTVVTQTVLILTVQILKLLTLTVLWTCFSLY